MWFTRVPDISFTTPLLGAALDWLEAVLPLIFVFIWIVSQVAAVFRKFAEKRPVAMPPRPAVRPAEGPPGEAVPVGPPPQRAAPVQGRAAPAQGGFDAELRRQIEQFLKGRPPETIEIEPVGPPAVPSASAVRKKPTKPRPSKKPAPGASKRLEGVGSSPRTEMPHLTSSLMPAESNEAQALPAAASVAVAGTIAGLLADPQSLRQAILLREVLDRPVERW